MSRVDPALLARAFAVALPEHKFGLTIEHNPHSEVGESVEEYYDAAYFLTPLERQKCISLDEVWTLRWSPESPDKQRVVVAATLDGVMLALVQQGVSYAG